jgi:hypothetical protein
MSAIGKVCSGFPANRATIKQPCCAANAPHFPAFQKERGRFDD